MIHDMLPDLARFYGPWLAAAGIARSEQVSGPVSGLVVSFDGLELPVLQLGLAVAGVLMARPLAPRRSPPLGLLKSVLVTLIMTVIAASWVIEARPGLLFTFVVAIGLGFSGYAVIELAGRQIEEFVKSVFEAARGAIDTIAGKKK